jgi:hypothetical protein
MGSDATGPPVGGLEPLEPPGGAAADARVILRPAPTDEICCFVRVTLGRVRAVGLGGSSASCEEPSVGFGVRVTLGRVRAVGLGGSSASCEEPSVGFARSGSADPLLPAKNPRSGSAGLRTLGRVRPGSASGSALSVRFGRGRVRSGDPL